jgi:hypothetical protein
MYELPEIDSAGVTFLLDADAIINRVGIRELRQQRAKESA